VPIAFRAVRGATTVDADDPDQVAARTATLVREMLDRNGLTTDDLVSAVFTTTRDIRSAFPATGARLAGLHDVPLLGAQEQDVEGGLARCIRVLLHVQTELPRAAIRHVYLEGATVLRPDLGAERAEP
jgi:chorismate mutase